MLAAGTYGPFLSSSMEMCDQKYNITMCPLCDKTCSYWKMSSACATARASHLFDNPATVFFSVFMALWGEQSPAALGLWGRGNFGAVPTCPSFLPEMLHSICQERAWEGGSGELMARCVHRRGGSVLHPGCRLVLLTHAL